MKRLCLMVIYLFLTSGFFFMSTNASPVFCAQEKQYFFAGLQSEIFVDPKADLTIEEITSKTFQSRFKPNNKKHFGFGLSTSANWIRFKLSGVAPPYRKNPEKLRIYFNYASFDDIRIYVPVIQHSDFSRIILKGGISNGIERDSKGFIFPIFDLPAKTATNEDIYIRISGPFTANFQLVLTEKNHFETLKLRITLFLAFVFGVMGAMVFYNIILYFMLRDKNYLLYVLYLAFMTTYQATIAGIVKLISLPSADFMTTHVVILCFLAIASHLVFAYFFLNVARTASVLVNLYKAAWVFCVFGIGFSLAAYVYQANFIAYLSGLFVPFLLLTTVIVTYKNGHWVSRYYLIAMAMLLAGVVIFAFRGFGLVEHNIYTSYAVLMTAALESVLFSFALADRIKRLQQTHMSLLEKEKKLSKITITDELTGLFNRRHFNNILMHSIQYARQSGQKVAMLLIDIDFFKSVNDTCGHQKGDEVLSALGGIIKEALRKSDFPCRIGGEEFAVLMPGTNISEALVVGERIRKEFAARPFKSFSGKIFFSTVSAGVGQYKNGETDHEFFEKTDKALYRAKKQGRNRIISTW